MTKARAATRTRGKWKPGTKLVLDLRSAVPVAKGSMKGFVVKTGPRPQDVRAIVTDAKTPELKAFERDVRALADREMTAVELPCAQEQPFEVLIVYYLPRPGGDFHKRTGALLPGARATPWSKPDLDKLERATLDALTGMVWDDDSRVVRVVKEKRYASAARDIGLWIELRVKPATVRELADANQQAMQVAG